MKEERIMEALWLGFRLAVMTAVMGGSVALLQKGSEAMERSIPGMVADLEEGHRTRCVDSYKAKEQLDADCLNTIMDEAEQHPDNMIDYETGETK